jgi:hypothetical protein
VRLVRRGPDALHEPEMHRQGHDIRTLRTHTGDHAAASAPSPAACDGKRFSRLNREDAGKSKLKGVTRMAESREGTQRNESAA